MKIRKTACLAFMLIAGCSRAGARAEIRPIADTACKSDVVLPGELPSHGEAVAFRIKAQIVQHLVRNCGFDAVLFEAPIYDFIGFHNSVQQRTAHPAHLDNAIGRFWLTRELASFRAWLFEQATAGRINVGGLDDQLSATAQYARATLPGLVGAECRDHVTRHVNWTYNDTHPFDEVEQRRLYSCVQTAAASGDQLVGNLMSYVHRQVDAVNARTRDEVMYENLRWYLGRLPAGSKVVIWTATVHAARTQGSARPRSFTFARQDHFSKLGRLFRRRDRHQE
jgi:erythromycin esterase-like protein